MFCSIVIPTIGRASLTRAVESVLAQQSAESCEVIVVNDAPIPLPPAAWQQAPGVRVIDTGGGRERCVARNMGAAIAAGRYLNFLDDDDWLLPGALGTWAALARQSSITAWLYGASQLIDQTGQVLYQFRHELTGNCLTPAMTGEWIPLQASAIASAAFTALGGFDTSFQVAEDKDLLVRVCHRYDIAGIDTPVAGILRGVWASSTDYSAVAAETQRSREGVFEQPDTLRRMRASAPTPYWRGRLARAYAISLVWNVRHRHSDHALRRAAAGALCAVGARLDLLRPTYWRAFTHHHLTPGFVPPAP